MVALYIKSEGVQYPKKPTSHVHESILDRVNTECGAAKKGTSLIRYIHDYLIISDVIHINKHNEDFNNQSGQPILP
jgi:hypothetical protein